MNLHIRRTHGDPVAVLESGSEPISTIQDALDLMANADYMGARSIIIRKEHLPAEFFDLKTRLAGEILQKFSNYRVRLAVVGDFSNTSKSLRDFIYESNKAGQFLFLSSEKAVLQKWDKSV